MKEGIDYPKVERKEVVVRNETGSPLAYLFRGGGKLRFEIDERKKVDPDVYASLNRCASFRAQVESGKISVY